MKSEIKTTEIIAIDKYSECLQDSIGYKSKRGLGEGPTGYVEIYEVFENDGIKTRKLIEKSNLVVYQGREWLVSRAFDYRNTNIGATQDEFICWFGLGTGGCPAGDPLDPIAPTVLDTDLDTECGINQTDVICADFRNGWYHKHPISSLTFTQDSDNNNHWLLISAGISVASDDANGFNISEAGLFTGSSNAGGFAGPFHLYARITFPTIVKSSSRQLDFVWFLYF